MKYLIGIFSIYFMYLCATPCKTLKLDENQASCCATKDLDTQKKKTKDNSENDCSNCNPLSCRHCCLIAFFFTQPLFIKHIEIEQIQTINYSEFIPPIVIFGIWQPPKLSFIS